MCLEDLQRILAGYFLVTQVHNAAYGALFHLSRHGRLSARLRLYPSGETEIQFEPTEYFLGAELILLADLVEEQIEVMETLRCPKP